MAVLTGSTTESLSIKSQNDSYNSELNEGNNRYDSL